MLRAIRGARPAQKPARVTQFASVCPASRTTIKTAPPVLRGAPRKLAQRPRRIVLRVNARHGASTSVPRAPRAVRAATRFSVAGRPIPIRASIGSPKRPAKAGHTAKVACVRRRPARTSARPPARPRARMVARRPVASSMPTPASNGDRRLRAPPASLAPTENAAPRARTSVRRARAVATLGNSAANTISTRASTRARVSRARLPTLVTSGRAAPAVAAPP